MHQRRQQFAQICHHDIRSLFPERLSLIVSIDPDDQPEATCMSGLDAGQRILDHDPMPRFNGEPSRRFQEGIRGRFPCQMKTIDLMTINSDIKQGTQADGFNDFGAMMARRHDGHF